MNSPFRVRGAGKGAPGDSPGVRRDESRARRGAVLVAVMICLLLISLLTASLVANVAAQRRQLRQEEQNLQAEWLAESALELAAARLAGEAAYAGETWNVAAEDLGGAQAATVTIRVGRGIRPRDCTVTAQVEYPAGSRTAVRRTKHLTVTLRSPL